MGSHNERVEEHFFLKKKIKGPLTRLLFEGERILNIKAVSSLWGGATSFASAVSLNL